MDQPWVFFGKNDAKAETPVLWPPPAKSWLIGKDSNGRRDWRQEEKGTTEDEMAGWHHRLDGCESELTPGAGDGQGGLVCCDSWGRKESDMTEWLNWLITDQQWGRHRDEQPRFPSRKVHCSAVRSVCSIQLPTDCCFRVCLGSKQQLGLRPLPSWDSLPLEVGTRDQPFQSNGRITLWGKICSRAPQWSRGFIGHYSSSSLCVSSSRMLSQMLISINISHSKFCFSICFWKTQPVLSVIRFHYNWAIRSRRKH